MVWGGVWRGFGELGCSYDEIVQQLHSLASQLRIALPVAWGQQDPGPRKGAPEAVGLISRLLLTNCLCSAMLFFGSEAGFGFGDD